VLIVVVVLFVVVAIVVVVEMVVVFVVVAVGVCLHLADVEHRQDADTADGQASKGEHGALRPRLGAVDRLDDLGRDHVQRDGEERPRGASEEVRVRQRPPLEVRPKGDAGEASQADEEVGEEDGFAAEAGVAEDDEVAELLRDLVRRHGPRRRQARRRRRRPRHGNGDAVDEVLHACDNH